MQQQSEALQKQLQEQGYYSPRSIAKAQRYVEAGKKYQARARERLDPVKASKDLERAIKKYRRALEINSQSLDAEIGLAEIFLEIENFPEALDASRKSLELSPGHPHALQLRGTALLELHSFEHARYIHGVLLELKHNEQAEALLAKMRAWHARQENNKSLEDNPEFQSFSTWLISRSQFQ